MTTDYIIVMRLKPLLGYHLKKISRENKFELEITFFNKVYMMFFMPYYRFKKIFKCNFIFLSYSFDFELVFRQCLNKTNRLLALQKGYCSRVNSGHNPIVQLIHLCSLKKHEISLFFHDLLYVQ